MLWTKVLKKLTTLGEIDRLCKVSITSGNDNYRHEMSAFFLRSGFKISIENDSTLKDSGYFPIHIIKQGICKTIDVIGIWYFNYNGKDYR